VKDRFDRSTFLKAAGAISLAIPASPALAYGRIIVPGSVGSDLKINTILKVLEGIPELSILVELIKETGLAKILNEIPLLTRYTVFAPNNNALNSIPGGLKTIKHLLKTLENLVVPELLLLEQLLGGLLGTLGGLPLNITRVEKVIWVDEIAKIIKGDIKAVNGVIHIIDAVPQQIIQ
jgi:uncharacterized surface protein with fasciclin (FAS1) repeats